VKHEPRRLNVRELALLRALGNGGVGPNEIDFSDAPLARAGGLKNVRRSVHTQYYAKELWRPNMAAVATNSETGPPRECSKCGNEKPAESFYRGRDVCRSCYLSGKRKKARAKTDEAHGPETEVVDKTPPHLEHLMPITKEELAFERDVWKRAAFHWWRKANNG
jgi:hypothetical protein